MERSGRWGTLRGGRGCCGGRGGGEDFGVVGQVGEVGGRTRGCEDVGKVEKSRGGGKNFFDETCRNRSQKWEKCLPGKMSDRELGVEV